MEFIELNRSFAPLPKERDTHFDMGSQWGRKFGGWLDWADLLEHRRVVILAEALSGKTEEFRNQARQLALQGRAAFFLRIEELADQGLEDALSGDEAQAFESWRSGLAVGFFFLDSVDEARLNRKSFESAIKNFARELGDSAQRAHVFVSCRVTDWRGDADARVVQRLLPAWDLPEHNVDADPLLDPIFSNTGRTEQPRHNEVKLHELMVVRLAPLDDSQCSRLADAVGVTNSSEFMQALRQSGLESFSERPGDLMDLAAYWRTQKKFDRLVVMVENAVRLKLIESDPFRPDSESLTNEDARKGAERLAAALTLGKTFTLKAPGHDPDPSLASGAIDPAAVLPDWTEAQRSALLRKGIFAPSTYGRVRLHHRSTQEYLTARWFERLMKHDGVDADVRRIFFVSEYGVETVVPSLRAEAAWLSLWRQDIRNEVARREPLVLMQQGDPASLPINARASVLEALAKKHQASDVADDSIDNRALWMFADESLSDAIQRAWTLNDRPEFRVDLLRLVREGAIKGCANLARMIAFDVKASDYHRIVALQALKACEDADSLRRVSRELVANPATVNLRIASGFVDQLFPDYLEIDGLLHVLAQSPSETERGTDGFSYRIKPLYDSCAPSKRTDLVAGLADLCLAKPHLAPHKLISAKHHVLASALTPIARAELARLGQAQPSSALIRLLMAVERADAREGGSEDDSLGSLVGANRHVKRALFWADMRDYRDRTKQMPVRYWEAHSYSGRLWGWDEGDQEWLRADLQSLKDTSERRLALSAMTHLERRRLGDSDARSAIAPLIADVPTLLRDLEDLLAPVRQDPYEEQHRLEAETHSRARRAQEEANKRAWRDFKEQLNREPDRLRDPAVLRSWQNGSSKLNTLTRWLERRTGNDTMEAAKQWRLLEEGFGNEVAEAYRDGMKALWRITKPERPRRVEGGGVTFKHTNVLSFAAVGIESSGDRDWTIHLSDNEVAVAAQHAVCAQRGCPDWIDDLLAAHTPIVQPIVARQLRWEWRQDGPGSGDYLHHYARSKHSLPTSLEKFLLEIVTSQEPPRIQSINDGLRILRAIKMDASQRTKVLEHRHETIENAHRRRELGLVAPLSGDAIHRQARRSRARSIRVVSQRIRRWQCRSDILKFVRPTRRTSHRSAGASFRNDTRATARNRLRSRATTGGPDTRRGLHARCSRRCSKCTQCDPEFLGRTPWL